MKKKQAKLIIKYSDVNLDNIVYDICSRGQDRFYRVHAPHTIYNLTRAMQKKAIQARRDAKGSIK